VYSAYQKTLLVTENTPECTSGGHRGKMSARALTRSCHFCGQAQAERLDSLETIRGKWRQFKNSRHMFSFRGDKAVTKQIRFSP